MRNNDQRQKNSQRQQPDERAPSAVAAVAVITGGANQRDEQEAEHRTDTCEQNRGRVRLTNENPETTDQEAPLKNPLKLLHVRAFFA